MSKPTHKTYTFSTFQELVDTVPGDRIADCLNELGITLQEAKLSAVLLYEAAVSVAKESGEELPPCPEAVLKVPTPFEWVDDGKGLLEARMHMEDGTQLFSVKMSPEHPIQPAGA